MFSGWTFIIPLQLTDSRACVELVALCRGGQTHYLQDVSRLSRLKADALHAELAVATDFQTQRGAGRRLGRLATRKGVLVGVPTAVGFLCSGVAPEARLAGVFTSFSIAAMLFWLRYAQHDQAPRTVTLPAEENHTQP